MKKVDVHQMIESQLVQQFADIAMSQGEALLRNDIQKFNNLYKQMDAVVQELKSRPGDQRSLLVALYSHPDTQVRLKAATRTLAVSPSAARSVLEGIAASKQYPQAGDAGMTLEGLDSGQFKPS